ncbi:hypothetical protein LTR84_009337 [Exophiala bonariae]|uniref:Mif2 N-terminal domain-containing protein n=1 Tax=Exophiala bonariae TaxID=1690606 RepID=A0AAV9MV03_9EURO|nr:hypothetical protein LTR84_009337 [Exophiala bonariae]
MARGPVRRRQPNQHRPIPRVANRTAATNAARAELERKLASKPIGQRPTDSDDSDRLVVKGNGRRGRNVPKQEIYATGAVGAGDKPGAYPTRAQRRRSLSNDTKEVLAQQRSGGRKNEDSSLKASDPPRQRKSSLTNGIATKSTAMPQPTIQPNTTTAATPSAIKAPGSILRPGQPTPTRETSFLGTLKPRGRQPSILQQIEHDSSSFDLDAEDEFLPDAVSTPLNLSNPKPILSSPATATTQPSTSRKRKLGHSDPLQPQEDIGLPVIGSPLESMHRRRLTPESSLPSIPVSTLRESGRKQRDRIATADDVMAPPQSSSSPGPSTEEANASTRPKNSRKKSEVKPVPAMTTEELQAALMPTKKRRIARERNQTRTTEFEIPADSDSPGNEPDEDSSFFPTKRGRRATRGREASNTTRPKPGKPRSGKSAAGGKQKGTAKPTAKLKPSTRNLIITTTTSAPVLSSSTSSRRNRETKSPSQLSSIAASTARTSKAGISTTELEPTSVSAAASKKRSGGSLVARAGEDPADKENRSSSISPRHGEIDEYADDGRHRAGLRKGASQAKTAVAPRNKWADIDAWDMDFEEIEVTTPSGSGGSSPLRR